MSPTNCLLNGFTGRPPVTLTKTWAVSSLEKREGGGGGGEESRTGRQPVCPRLACEEECGERTGPVVTEEDSFILGEEEII